MFPDFGADFFPTLWDQLPLADRAGPPWRRRDACFACATELAGSEDPRTITLEISLRDAPDFEVEVDLPMARCAACGVLQAFERGRSLEFNLSEALTRAFDAAAIKP